MLSVSVGVHGLKLLYLAVEGILEAVPPVALAETFGHPTAAERVEEERRRAGNFQYALIANAWDPLINE